ncbi:MAG: tRNA pseudouridine(13) synthase TruD, partial [Phycisphaerae bacterium]
KTGSHRQAFAAVDRGLKRLYVSAYQGWLFNRVVAERIEQIDRIWPGDLAWRHANGAVFRVEDLPSEQRRCEAFEISPTGPLFGYRMTCPTGQAGRLEQQILQDEGLSLSDFRAERAHKVKGGRRPLRFQPADWSVEPGRDELGEFLELRFALPPGCYATALLRELCKRDLAEH